MSPTTTQRSERALVRSGAAIIAATAVVGSLKVALPGGPPFSLVPSVIGAALVPLILLFGRRVPRSALLLLGPIGVALITATVATTDGGSDLAIFYAWPVLWVAFFFGRRATALIVGCIALGHGLALLLMDGGGNLDRWIDVVASAALIATVVQALAARNRRLVRELTAEARIDPLTGLLNRRGLDERFQAELARARREGTELAVVAVDVDRFKSINDQFGHDGGDQVLTWIARTIERQTRASDLTARLGGDEFLVVLPVTGAEAAHEFADRLRAAVAAGSRRLPERLEVSISAGVAAGPADAALSEAADRALYEAKARGRNSVAVSGTVDLSRRN